MTTDGRPECFALLARVFPRGDDGLRTSPPECLACDHKTDCLRQALITRQGAEVDQGGQHERRGASRAVRGFRRWSALKAAKSRNRKET